MNFFFHAQLNGVRDPNDWLSRITRKPNFVIHPIKHILLILFLCEDFNQFLNTKPYSDKPYGDGPWFCLNPVADHYKQQVVYSHRIKFYSQKKIPIGYFTCSCGFTYRRVGSAKIEDHGLIGKVVNFGHVWEAKLKELLLEKKYPLTVLARKMSCHYQTVLRYSDKLGLRHLINTTVTSSSTTYKSSEKTINQKLKKEYTSDILDYIKQYPSCRRTDIQKTLVKQCSWLDKYDKEWYAQNLPSRLSRGKPKGKQTNWNKRDEEYANELKKLVDSLLAQDKQVIKMTKSSLSAGIGKKSIIISNLNKLPKTKEFLEEVSEDGLSYKLRKVDYLCKKLFNEKGKFTRSDITKKVGVYDNEEIDERIKENLKNYMGV